MDETKRQMDEMDAVNNQKQQEQKEKKMTTFTSKINEGTISPKTRS